MKSSSGSHGQGEWGGGRGFNVATFQHGCAVLRYHVKCVMHLIMARDITCLIDARHIHTIDLV